MERRVVIVGAGISALLACKYTMEKGFNPIVFEAESSIGGVWFNHTIKSTKVQNTREAYRFSDFDWPSPEDDDGFPPHNEALEYVRSYAKNFGLLPRIRLNCRVIGIQHVGVTAQEMEAWDLWGGTGTAFGSAGKWHVKVHNKETDTVEVHQAEFIILCIGRFSGLPNIPKLPPDQSIERFRGKVLNPMEYSALDDSAAAELIEGKRITIIGSGKSAVDIAAECADANGVRHPCTMIQRTIHWFIPDLFVWGAVGCLFMNRFGELLVHMPGESFLRCLFVTLLSPLRWGASKFVESCLRWKLPLKKYGMIPDRSFLEDLSSCTIGILPKNFYDKVEDGSIILKRLKKFGFVEEGVIIDGEDQPIRSDVVILATGYKGDEKLANMFKSPIFRELIARSPTSSVPLYRQTIHPHIPSLAVIGYAESLANLPLFEIQCQWLAEFLEGNFVLPSIKEMEKDVKVWEEHRKQYAGRNFWRSCIGVSNIWAKDQLCKDMGCNPRRKKGFFAEWFQPYGPTDYVGLTRNS
ncbi:probable flavin-containing monooxygenase 1 [Punica granatum]|uniref:Flavin-containing monooxygenase n=2 Tax=Punica granatum TaxID=22663 RepID=A0A218WJ85_PUNGR|nr:probable flavin-containing monooxygenase 1 [Punica granatum]OWM72865.1 hypothetical protein CDL15_Pgr021171 [Punica granatum]PKI56379.1 hypothetical protein CRG98_023221 [Punica granatum]